MFSDVVSSGLSCVVFVFVLCFSLMKEKHKSNNFSSVVLFDQQLALFTFPDLIH